MLFMICESLLFVDVLNNEFNGDLDLKFFNDSFEFIFILIFHLFLFFLAKKAFVQTVIMLFCCFHSFFSSSFSSTIYFLML